MAITTLLTLEDAIGRDLKRSSVYSSTGTLVADTLEWINRAEDRIFAELRIRAMEAHADLVLSAAIAGGTAGGTADALTLTPSGGSPSLIFDQSSGLNCGTGDYSIFFAFTTAGTATAGLGARSARREHRAAGRHARTRRRPGAPDSARKRRVRWPCYTLTKPVWTTVAGSFAGGNASANRASHRCAADCALLR